MLLNLQETELAMLAHKKRLQEIETALADDEAVREAQAAVSSAEDALKPLRAHLKDLEFQMQTNRSKKQTTEQRLYSGSVKNPKQLQEMQQEIEALGRWHDELEERQLMAMLEIEEAEGDLKAKQAHLEAVTAAWQNAHQDLLAEQDERRTAFQELGQKRAELRQKADAEALAQYDGLRPRKGNRPMAALDDRSCSVCGVEQTSVIVSQANSGQLVPCASCGRILVRR